MTYQKLSNKTSCLSFISPDGQTTWLQLKATHQIKVLDCAFCCSFSVSEVYSLWRSNTMMTWPARISTSLKPEWRICLCGVSGHQPSMLVQQQPHCVWPTRSLILTGFIKGCFPFSSVGKSADKSLFPQDGSGAHPATIAQWSRSPSSIVTCP